MKKCINRGCPYNVEEYCEVADECAVFEPAPEKICATCRSYVLHDGICISGNKRDGIQLRRPTDACGYWEERYE